MNAADWFTVVLMAVGLLITIFATPFAPFGLAIFAIGLVLFIVSQAAGGIVDLAGWGGKTAVRASNRTQGNIATTNILTGGDLESNKTHGSIDPEGFISTQFTIATAAILHYNIEVLGDEQVNVIVTKEEEFQKFRTEPEIKFSEKASRMGVNHDNVKTRLGTGRWRLIIDNTGRTVGVEGNHSVDFELMFDVRE
jgi:hypothetical protein